LEARTIPLLLLALLGCEKANDVAVEGDKVFGQCQGAFRECFPDDGLDCETNTEIDANHCGACFQACDSTHGRASCSLSLCSIACDSGFADCNGRPDDGCEIDLRSDLNHCGACGQTCPAGATCSNGACLCPSGSLPCEGQCVNVTENPLNCGACGVSCSGPHSSQVCQNGSCLLSCLDNYLDCDGIPSTGCEVNPASDPDHCGGCGVACPRTGGTATCDQGTCKLSCSSGYHKCGNDCVPDSSMTQCGPSCVPCSAPAHATPTCQSGICDFLCDSGYSRCGDSCFSLNTDPANCGACGRSCLGGDCAGGVCQPFLVGNSIPTAKQVFAAGGYVYVENKRYAQDGSAPAGESHPPLAGVRNGNPVWVDSDNVIESVGGTNSILATLTGAPTVVASNDNVFVVEYTSNVVQCPNETQDIRRTITVKALNEATQAFDTTLWTYSGDISTSTAFAFSTGHGVAVQYRYVEKPPCPHAGTYDSYTILRHSSAGILWGLKSIGVGTYAAFACGPFLYWKSPNYATSTIRRTSLTGVQDNTFSFPAAVSDGAVPMGCSAGELLWNQRTNLTEGATSLLAGGVYAYDIANSLAREIVPPNTFHGSTLGGIAVDGDAVFWVYPSTNTLMGVIR
jgi:hypothetical protein